MKKPPVGMWSKWPLLLILVGTFAQAGELNFGRILASGDVAQFESGRESSARALSRGHLQALTLWLGLHRAAWRGMSTPASNEQRLLRLNLKDTNGNSVSIDVIARADGGFYMRLISAHTWSYKSFGGLVKSAAAVQPLTDNDLALLKEIIGER